ncbi:MAG TPA: hypothetical protein VFT01_05970 [Homoserinimonas sp.]|nr:hypothetical protein [Homoserinimonas sp.]
MSDFIQYTQWKQREQAMPAELEQARANAERVAEDIAARRAARRKAWVAREIVAALRAIRRAAGLPVATGNSDAVLDAAVVDSERELAHR